MLDLKFVRDNIDKVELALRQRGLEISLSEFATKDVERRRALAEIEELRHRRNHLSEEVGKEEGWPAQRGPAIDGRGQGD